MDRLIDRSYMRTRLGGQIEDGRRCDECCILRKEMVCVGTIRDRHTDGLAYAGLAPFRADFG